MSEIPFEAWEQGEIVKEIEALRQENDQLHHQIRTIKENLNKDAHKVFGDYYDNLRWENEQLREALKKLSPFLHSFGHEDEVYEQCIFCGKENEGHTNDCEYIQLTGYDE